jgi:hypothetical protein
MLEAPHGLLYLVEYYHHLLQQEHGVVGMSSGVDNNVCTYFEEFVC